jgi:hypothetical protein
MVSHEHDAHRICIWQTVTDATWKTIYQALSNIGAELREQQRIPDNRFDRFLNLREEFMLESRLLRAIILAALSISCWAAGVISKFISGIPEPLA